MSATWFEVVSAEYGTVIPVLDFGEGPTEYGRDMLYVRATSKKRAKILMVRAMRRRLPPWKRPDWLSEGNPFRGMKAEKVNLEPWPTSPSTETQENENG